MVEHRRANQLDLELSHLRHGSRSGLDCEPAQTQTPMEWIFSTDYLQAGAKLQSVEAHIGARERKLGMLKAEVNEAEVKAMMMRQHKADAGVQVNITDAQDSLQAGLSELRIGIMCIK